MKLFKAVLITFLTTGLQPSIAQQSEQLLQINSQVWEKFYKAFEDLDYRLMAEIHTKDLVRIPANQHTILDYDTYINNYKTQFHQAREDKISQSISLRFLERITNDSTASERGIYRFSINPGAENEQHYYGKFHVLLVKRDNSWKILMDYDSNENDTIDEEDYLDAFAMDDLSPFID